MGYVHETVTLVTNKLTKKPLQDASWRRHAPWAFMNLSRCLWNANGAANPLLSHLSRLSADALNAHKDPVFGRRKNLSTKSYTQWKKLYSSRCRRTHDPAPLIVRYEIETWLDNGVIEPHRWPCDLDGKNESLPWISTKDNYKKWLHADIPLDWWLVRLLSSYTLGAMYPPPNTKPQWHNRSTSTPPFKVATVSNISIGSATTSGHKPHFTLQMNW